MSANNFNLWPLRDRLGSVRAVINDAGTLKDSLAYDGFGNITSETNAAFRGWYSACFQLQMPNVRFRSSSREFVPSARLRIHATVAKFALRMNISNVLRTFSRFFSECS